MADVSPLRPTPETCARLTAEFMLDRTPDLEEWKRVASRTEGVPRYTLRFKDGERYVMEFAFDGRRE